MQQHEMAVTKYIISRDTELRNVRKKMTEKRERRQESLAVTDGRPMKWKMADFHVNELFKCYDRI